jgi:hypothetical protein
MGARPARLESARWAIPSADHPGEVPRISYFYGIAITMYFYDHEPPHFLGARKGWRHPRADRPAAVK